MQPVSWIDADQLKALVAQIAPQEASEEMGSHALELETAPDRVPDPRGEAWRGAMNWMEPDAPPVVEIKWEATAEPAPQTMMPELEEEEVEEADHGVSLRNPAAALPLSRIRDKLRAIRQRATEAGILTRVSEAGMPLPSEEVAPPPSDPVSDATSEVEVPDDNGDVMAVETHTGQTAAMAGPSVPPFAIPQGSRDERLAAFAGWARQVLREDGGHMLVMSDDGEVLWGGEAKAGLVLSTMMAWGSAIRASASAACATPPVIRQPLASGNVLTVIPCETAGGVIHAAVAAPAGLTDEVAQLLRGALCAAMAGW